MHSRHALGFVHEQANPFRPFNISCEEERVKRHAEKTKVDPQFVCEYYSPDDPNISASAFDPDSVMFYPLPAELVGREYADKENSRLSTLDISVARVAYPFADMASDVLASFE